MSINPLAFSRLTQGKIKVKNLGSTEWINLGTQKSVSHELQADRVEVIGSGKGFTYIRGKLPSKLTHMYSSVANEVTPELMEIVMLSTAGSSVVQNSGTALAASFTANLRRALSLNKINVDPDPANFLVKNSDNTVTYVAGTDYDLDAGGGWIEIIKGGSITPGSTINVTFNCAAVTRKGYSPNSKRIFEGDVNILFYDQFSNEPVEEHSFYGQYYVTQSSGGTDGIKEFTMEFLPLRNHLVYLRND